MPGANLYKEECKDQKNRRGEATEGVGTVEVVMEGDECWMSKNGEGKSSVRCVIERMVGFIKFANVDDLVF